MSGPSLSGLVTGFRTPDVGRSTQTSVSSRRVVARQSSPLRPVTGRRGPGRDDWSRPTPPRTSQTGPFGPVRNLFPVACLPGSWPYLGPGSLPPPSHSDPDPTPWPLHRPSSGRPCRHVPPPPRPDQPTGARAGPDILRSRSGAPAPEPRYHPLDPGAGGPGGTQRAPAPPAANRRPARPPRPPPPPPRLPGEWGVGPEPEAANSSAGRALGRGVQGAAAGGTRVRTPCSRSTAGVHSGRGRAHGRARKQGRRARGEWHREAERGRAAGPGRALAWA